MIDPDGPIPIYKQLADILEGRITSGEFQPNRALPSEKYLVEQYGVARGTARRSVQLLRDRDLVYTVPQRGTYVKDRSADN